MKLYNIVKVYTATVGTGTVTLGSAVPSFITFATAGVTTGSTVSYAIEDGNNREVGTGVYTSGAETLTRNVVTSTNSNNLITLSGNAVVFITGLAADLSSDTANTANTLIIRDGSGNFAAGEATLSSSVVPLISGGTSASSTLTLQSTSGAGTSDAIIFRTASQLERIRVTTAGDVNIGSANNAGNTLRLFDVYNTNTGSSAGSVVRLITSDDAGTGTAVGQIIKYKVGLMSVQNTETGTNGVLSFNVGASERARITSTGAFGIGTASPATESTNAKLTVVGAVSQSASSLATSNTNAGFTVRTNASSGYQLAIGATSVDGSPYIQGVNFNGGAVASNLILQGYGGNVGIGTPSPSTKLHVSGGRSTFFANSETYAIGVGYSGTTIAGYIGGSANNSNADIVFSNAGGSERMRIQDGGNVGIGTASPDALLTVNGVGAFGDGSASAPSIANTGDLNTGLWFPAADTIAASTNGSERMRINSTGDVLVGSATDAGNALRYLDIYNTNTGSSAGSIVRLITSNSAGTGTTSADIVKYKTGLLNIANNDTSGQIAFGTGGSERMRIDSSGNVGIGTTNPSAKLDVVGNLLLSGQSTASQYINVGYGRSGNGFSYIDFVGDTTYSPGLRLIRGDGGANTQSSLQHRGTGDLQLFAYEAAPIVFYSSSAERMRITSTGNVGIGTASPAYQLQLSTDSAAKPTTNTWTIASDARLKTVLGDYEKGLDAICALRPVRYKYNGFGGMVADGKEHISIVAQEAQEVFPECIGTFQGKLHGDDEQETELLNYNGHAITFALINAIKELKAEIDILKARN